MSLRGDKWRCCIGVGIHPPSSLYVLGVWVGVTGPLGVSFFELDCGCGPAETLGGLLIVYLLYFRWCTLPGMPFFRIRLVKTTQQGNSGSGFGGNLVVEPLWAVPFFA